MTIKLKFDGFYDDFKYENNPFIKYLIDNEFISIDEEYPELIIYGEDFNKFKRLEKKKILFKVENIPYNDWDFKYKISYNIDDKYNFFLVNFFYYPYFQDYLNNDLSKSFLNLKNKKKTKYLNFICSNPYGKLRNKYIDFLCEKKIKFDSLGKYRNNKKFFEDPNQDNKINKIKEISNYKYTIAFENSYNKNYISEKIWEPLSVNSIPIYHGGELVFQIFNKKKFIYVNSRTDFTESIKQISKIDNSLDFYNEILNEDIFINQEIKLNYKFNIIAKKFYNFLKEVINDKDIKVQSKYINRFKFLYNKFLRSFI